jgi:hypothetical protein
MAVNLVGMVMQYLTPDRIGRIAAAFNLDPKSAQSVVEVSVPSLLAGLTSLALQQGGAQKAVDAVRQHSGTLHSRANAVGGSANQAVLADKGTQWFSSLIGDQNHSALTGGRRQILWTESGRQRGASRIVLPCRFGHNLQATGHFEAQCLQSNPSPCVAEG